MKRTVAAVAPLIAAFSSFFGLVSAVAADDSHGASSEARPDVAATPRNSFRVSFMIGSRSRLPPAGRRARHRLPPSPVLGCARGDRVDVVGQEKSVGDEFLGCRSDLLEIVAAILVALFDRRTRVAGRSARL